MNFEGIRLSDRIPEMLDQYLESMEEVMQRSVREGQFHETSM